MSRRIVQIAAVRESKNTRSILYALSEDGEVFYLTDPNEDDHPDSWVPLPPLPEVES
jgi:hypothetical protein